MNEPDALQRRLAAIADDAPSQASIVSTERLGYHRRVRRRRWQAIGAVVAVVLVVTGATTLLAPGGSSAPKVLSVPATTVTLGSRAAESTAALPRDSRLVPFAGTGITSPVSVPASWVSYDHDGPDVDNGPTSLLVNWTGKEPTAMQTVDVRAGTTGTGQYRGYLITAERPTLSVFAPGYDTTAVSRNITVHGHPAQLLTAPKGSFDNTYAAPAQARIAWQLGDGRWIAVWTVGESDSVLLGFASAITEKPTVFPSNLSVGLTLEGYTAATSTYSSYVSQMAGPSLLLCQQAASSTASSAPASTAPDSFAAASASSVPDSAPAASAALSSAAVSSADSGSDPSYVDCLDVHATVADGGFLAGVIEGSETNAEFSKGIERMTVGGIRVSVQAGFQVAWTQWGAATIVVTTPAKSGLTAQELADIAASVRLSPSMQVKNEPDAMVESSMKQYPQETIELTG